MKRNAWVPAILMLSVAAGAIAPAEAQPRWRGSRTDKAFQIRVGAFLPDGGGPLWDDVESRFTMRVSDLDDFSWGVSYVTAVNENIEFGLNLDAFDATVLSEEAFYVDSQGFPILHDTTLEQVPLTADVRFLLGSRDRRRGARGPVVYLGGGAGANFWEYREVGDFVDESDPLLPVFFGINREDGVAFQAHALAGIEMPVSRNVNLLLEGRYTWADDQLDRDLASLDRIELGGLWTQIGLSFRF